MADNIIVKNANNVNETVRTTETGGVHIPHHVLSINGSAVSAANPLPASTENVFNKFREAFESYSPGTRWTQTLGTNDIIALDGNSASASYLVISKDPLTANTESSISTIDTWDMPFEMAMGLHLSQRTLGQEFAIEVVSTEASLPAFADLAISSISQSTTTLTVNTTAAHNLFPGMRIGIRDCADQRFNYPALVVATTPTATQFTVTAGPGGALPSVTAGPFTSGFVYYRPALGYAPNGSSMIFENATATNASFFVRSESGDVLPSGTIAGSHSVTTATTASVQSVVSARSYSFLPTSEFRLLQYINGIQWSDTAVDALTAATSRYYRTQVVPDIGALFRIRVRATNLHSFTRPSAEIVSAAKTGTTTATVTTATNHGLVTGDVVQTYGARDQTNFANITTAAAVTVTGPTTFTVVWGAAVTATTFGGFVVPVKGGVALQGAVAQTAQSISRTSNVVSVVGSAAWAGVLIGDYINLVGVRDNTTGASLGLDGSYRVRNLATTTMELEPIGTAPTGADVVSTNCGGGVIKRTDLRISFVRAMDFERQRVEIVPRPGTDIANSIPAQITNTPAVTISSGTVTTVTGVTTVSAVTAANLGFPGLAADVASAALTTTTTTTAITPTFGTAYSVNIPVTAVTGTGPTLDVSIEESDDAGTNWFKVYDFPRITAVGMYRSPLIRMVGNRIRYVQTVGGTSPSFTRAINRLQSSSNSEPVRQLIDRALAVNTLNSTTASLDARDTGNRVQIVVNMGAITTTAPAFQIEGSDDNGVGWYLIGTPLTGVASSTVQVTIPDINAALLRVRVSTAGSGATLNSLTLKAHD